MSLSTTPIYFDHFPSLLSPMWPPLFSLMWPKFQLPLYISTTSLSPLSSPVSSLSCGRNFGYPYIFQPLPFSPLSSLLFEISATPIYFNHIPSLLSSLSYVASSPLSSLLSSGSSPVSSLLLSPLSSLLSRMIQQP
jgi:hypothetical protein